MAMVVSILLGVVGTAHASNYRLVSCQTPVDVRFIATPGQVKPEFSEDVAPGQKHWWSYGCKMQQTEADVYGQEESGMERRLSANGTTTTTTTAAATTTAASNSSNTSSSSSGGSGNSTTTDTNTTDTLPSKCKGTDNKPILKKCQDDDDCKMKSVCKALVAKQIKDKVATTTAKVTEAETTGCIAAFFNPVIAGLSLSLPFVMADDFLAQTKKLDRVDVLLPCSTLVSPLKDLDGDGSLDCKMTKEQSLIAEEIPALNGDWKVASSFNVASGRRNQNKENGMFTFGDGAMCSNNAEDAKHTWTHQNEKIELFKSLLPLAVSNVAGFTHKGKRCDEETCEASMWSFDLTYPSSECTSNLGGWVRPTTAKMLANGQLVLIRGASATPGTTAQRPPLMEDIETFHDVRAFANGLAAAAQSEFEILILQKEGRGTHKAFVEADVDANGALSLAEFETAIDKLPAGCADAL